MKIIFIIFISLLFFCNAFATIINIPAEQFTIQAGINVASNGDTVIVQPGTYVENINYNGKNITVASLFLTTQDTSYISNTIINGNQNGSVVTFESGEDSTSVLTGFTITNGDFNHGGGIYCGDASPSLKNLKIENNMANIGGGISCSYNSCPIMQNLTITNNSATLAAGGIYCYQSTPNLETVTIVYNSADYGGGIYCSNSSPILANLTITNNSVGDYGGGIYFFNSSPNLENVTLVNNSAGYYGGGIYCYQSSPNLINVSIADNSANSGGGIYCHYSSSPNLINVSISDNSAYSGGGIYCSGSSLSLENVTIVNNLADYGGGLYMGGTTPVFSSVNRCNIYLNNVNNRGSGSDIYSSGQINVMVDTFTVVVPTDFHAFPIENFTFNILHGIQEQVNSDLYVSPQGNNGNSGLNEDEPLQTIHYACSIILADSLNPHTIHLAEGIYSPSTNGEFFPISLPDNVSLTGENEENVILDAEGIAGIMTFNYVDNVTISYLTISNGEAYNGGGINCSNSSPILENVTIVNNSADYGGGINCSNSSPILENVTIVNNSADYGGGINCGSNSNPHLENVTIAYNSANYRGGGINCSSNSNPHSENVTIANNSADYGGGICCYNNSNPTLVNCIMWDNETEEVYFYPDYIVPSITIAYSDIEGGINSIVTNNMGTVYWLEGNIDANPLFVDALNGDYHLTESSPCIDAGDPDPQYNDPDGTIADMGAFYLETNILYANFIGSPTLGNLPLEVQFTDLSNGNVLSWQWDFGDSNTSTEQNPSNIFHNLGSFTVSLTVTDENDSTNTEIKEDYIVAVYSGPVFHVSTIGSNETGDGSISNPFATIQHGINMTSEGDTVLVQPGTYVENINYNGKNITVASLLLTTQDTSYISQTIIDGNHNESVVIFESGESSSAILIGFTIINGNSPYGGGIVCYYSSPSLINLEIIGNTATIHGGGIYCEHSSPNIDSLTIVDNSANDRGGGIYCYDYSNPNISNLTITGNSANRGGGITCNMYSSPNILNAIITGNSANNYGGGIRCNWYSNPIISNTIITGNSANDWGGGIYCYNHSSPNISNVTITGNSAGVDGGGIYIMSNSSLSLVNCIMWNNTPEEIYFSNSYNPNTITIAYSDIEGGEVGIVTNNNGTVNWLDGNIDADPLFVDAINENYHLSPSSPCIDAGTPDTTGLNLPDYDLNGNTRIVNGIIDMGAYEYQGGLAYTNIKVFLEGPYDAVGGIMNYSLTLPTTSPYDIEDIGSLPTVTGHSLVDWIQVKLRTTATGSTVDSCNAFLLEDGSVVDVNGNSSLPFYNTAGNEYYVVIHHRNHLDIMSAVKHTFGSSQGEATNIILTTSGSIYGDGYQELETGVYGMYSGDINNDGEVTTSDYTGWYNAYITGSSGYQTTDLNMDTEVTTSDYTKWYNNFIVGASSSVPSQTRESSVKSKKIILRKIEKNTKINVRRKHEKQVKN